MKRFFFFLLLLLSGLPARGQGNRAIRLDGKDNNLRTGMGILTGPWTLEAWIRGDDRYWKEQEVLFGGGEYSELNITDNLPLELRNGRLHNAKTGLTSNVVLDDKWHHAAISSDGSATRLYLDGLLIDQEPVAYSILPGALGVQETAESVFGGLLDEVRIWRAAVSEETLRAWMNRPLSPRHPDFRKLTGYYPFDEAVGDVAINWVGKGDQAWHVRNGRVNYRGSAPLACTVPNDNQAFKAPDSPQQLFNAIVIESEWDAAPGSRDEQMLKLRLAVQGQDKPLSLTELTLDLSETTSLRDLSGVQVYYTGQTARSAVRRKLFAKTGAIPRRLVFRQKKGQPLAPGIHYFLVTASIAPKATPGNCLRVTVPSFRLGGKPVLPEATPQLIAKQVVPGSQNDPNVIRVLQWNIWHGGRHVVNEGIPRIIDLIRTTGADVVTMQEAYGSQQRIADSLRFQLHTASAGENLALLSRYPLSPLSSRKKMNSNPAFVLLPDGRRVLVNSGWLRYAYRPEYTWVYPGTGLDPAKWVAEDSTLALADIRYLLEKDTRPYVPAGDIPVIIGGDFNSCSHLDWTAAAARLHFGYGPVAFPVSRYLVEEGFRDSFREMNPDEVARPEGTFAAIYGHLQVCRIDFLYYRGSSIRAIASKIVKTAPEIDDIWASDHSAVLTTFHLAPGSPTRR